MKKLLFLFPVVLLLVSCSGQDPIIDVTDGPIPVEETPISWTEQEKKEETISEWSEKKPSQTTDTEAPKNTENSQNITDDTASAIDAMIDELISGT